MFAECVCGILRSLIGMKRQVVRTVLGTRFWTVFYGQIQNLVFSYLLARQLFMLCQIHGFILIRGKIAKLLQWTITIEEGCLHQILVVVFLFLTLF